MNTPLVSVIVPAYNRERFLALALESIFRQDYRPLEVIVVDDGSVDGTAAVARSFPEVHYVHQTNQGVAAARNAGIAASRAEFVAFLDSDDLWTPNKLSRQVPCLLENPQIGYVLAWMQAFLERGCQRPSWLRPDALEKAEIGISPCTLLVRRAVLDRIGGFDPQYHVGEDTDWFSRAADAGIKHMILPDVLLQRRIHDSHLTGQARSHPALLRILKASIDRKRNANTRAITI